MNILGLDLSLTACGVCKPDGSLLTITPQTKGDERLDEIAAAVRDLAVSTAAALVVMEEAAFMSHSAGQLGMVQGAVRLQLMRKRVRYVVVPPACVKKFLTGKGNAKKPDMRVEWFKRSGADVRDDNQVDAAVLHAMAMDYYGQPVIKVPAGHREALAKIKWPEITAADARRCRECGCTERDLPDGAVWVSEDQCSSCGEAS